MEFRPGQEVLPPEPLAVLAELLPAVLPLLPLVQGRAGRSLLLPEHYASPPPRVHRERGRPGEPNGIPQRLAPKPVTV